MNLFLLVMYFKKSLYKTAQLLRLLFDKTPSYFFWLMCDGGAPRAALRAAHGLSPIAKEMW